MGQEKGIKEHTSVLNAKLTKMEIEKMTEKERELRIWNHGRALDIEMIKSEQSWHKKWDEDRKYYKEHGHYPEQVV